MTNFTRQLLSSFISAVICAVVILLGSIVIAQQISKSSLYHQSKILGSLAAEDSVDITGVLSDSGKRDTLVKFLGAVTSAYINFELIPVNETDTFVAVLQGLNDNITISGFEYQRKNLVITGYASEEQSYESFVKALTEQNYFKSVSGHVYTTKENEIHFEVECIAQSAPNYGIGFPAE